MVAIWFRPQCVDNSENGSIVTLYCMQDCTDRFRASIKFGTHKRRRPWILPSRVNYGMFIMKNSLGYDGPRFVKLDLGWACPCYMICSRYSKYIWFESLLKVFCCRKWIHQLQIHCPNPYPFIWSYIYISNAFFFCRNWYKVISTNCRFVEYGHFFNYGNDKQSIYQNFCLIVEVLFPTQLSVSQIVYTFLLH